MSAFPSEADIGRVCVGGFAPHTNDPFCGLTTFPANPAETDQYFCVTEHSILRKNLGHREFHRILRKGGAMNAPARATTIETLLYPADTAKLMGVSMSWLA